MPFSSWPPSGPLKPPVYFSDKPRRTLIALGSVRVRRYVVFANLGEPPKVSSHRLVCDQKHQRNRENQRVVCYTLVSYFHHFQHENFSHFADLIGCFEVGAGEGNRTLVIITKADYCGIPRITAETQADHWYLTLLCVAIDQSPPP